MSKHTNATKPKWMRIDPQMGKEEMVDLTMEVLERNLPTMDEHDDTWVTQRVTRGLRLAGADIQGAAERPTVIIECFPIPFQERAHYYLQGMPIITPSVRRTPPDAMSPRAKTHNYINLIQADLEARSQDPDAYAVLLDVNGNLCEGNGSNIFVVKDGRIRTPRDRFVLCGISRQTTIELAQELGIEIAEDDIDSFDAYTADEIFVTSTSLCICPVSTFNGAPVGGGAIPGPITERLQAAYSGLVGIDVVEQYTRWAR